MYREERAYHNQQRAIFAGIGLYDIPIIKPVDVDLRGARWVSFNNARSEKNPENAVCHTFIDDYQFERLWNNPTRYISMFKRFKAVTAPDFSIYTDFPVSVQIYNHFRKHWLAHFYQNEGITIIPTIAWSDKRSFKWCFDGEPRGGAVTISDCVKGVGGRNHWRDKSTPSKDIIFAR